MRDTQNFHLIGKWFPHRSRLHNSNRNCRGSLLDGRELWDASQIERLIMGSSVFWNWRICDLVKLLQEVIKIVNCSSEIKHKFAKFKKVQKIEVQIPIKSNISGDYWLYQLHLFCIRKLNFGILIPPLGRTHPQLRTIFSFRNRITNLILLQLLHRTNLQKPKQTHRC